MFKKIIVLACFLCASLNVSADVLHKAEIAHFQALSGLSSAEAQEFILQAYTYVSKLHELGYSQKEIDSMINQQAGAVAQQSQDLHDGYIRTRTMWILLAVTVVVSSYIAATAAISGYVGGKIVSEFN